MPSHSPEGPQELEELIVAKHGELLSGKALRSALGFRSERSFFRAIEQGSVPVRLFRIAGRRGQYARARDVANWLSRLGLAEADNHSAPESATRRLLEKKGGAG